MSYNRPLKYEIEATRFAQSHGLDGVFFGSVNKDGSEEYQAGFFDETNPDGFTGGWYTPFDGMTYDVIADESGVRWSSDSHRSFPHSRRNPNVPDA